MASRPAASFREAVVLRRRILRVSRRPSGPGPEPSRLHGDVAARHRPGAGIGIGPRSSRAICGGSEETGGALESEKSRTVGHAGISSAVIDHAEPHVLARLVDGSGVVGI